MYLNNYYVKQIKNCINGYKRDKYPYNFMFNHYC